MRNDDAAKPLLHLVHRPILVPLVEEVPDRGPRPELLRKIAPRSPRAEDPENRIDDAPPLSRATPCLEVARRKQVGDQFPLRVAERVAEVARR